MSWLLINALVGIAYLGIFLNWIFAFGKSNKKPSNWQPTVSVLIPVRNERSTLPTLLKQLQIQSYPAELVEVLVLNDHSTDGIESWFLEENLPSNFKLISVKGEGKKLAITEGVGAAKGEIILCTDGDCEVGKDWISTLISTFSESTYLVSGPVVLTANSLFEKVLSSEFQGLNAIGAASISRGVPTMANGANLAYRKSAFLEVNGYAGNENIASGDDEFLMHRIQAKYSNSVDFCYHSEAIVSTPAPRSFRQFWNQRKRWVSKSTSYEHGKSGRFMQLAWLFHLLFGVNVGLLMFDVEFASSIVIAFALIRIFAEGGMIIASNSFYRSRKSILFYLIGYIPYGIYVVVIPFAAIFGGYVWKERKR